MNDSSIGIFNHAIFAGTNGVSVVVCLVAAILVLLLKLYGKLVYRLALYQVLSALAMASVEAMQVVLINYEKSPNNYRRFCTAIGFLVQYTIWMKLLFTMWVTFHLFCFAVLHKNLKKLEVLYVVTSLLVPMVISIIPLVTNSYGRSPDGNICCIYANTNASFIERLALWDGPAMTILIAASIAMVVMVIILANQVCRRSKYEPITDSDEHWKALKQLLPLAAFPVLFFVFEMPLYGKLVYRLAFYQVLSALAMASVEALQVVLINYEKSPNNYRRFCTAIGFLVQYTIWMKLLFTMWVSIYLFCFAVLHKNLKKFELLYVVTSLLVPMVYLLYLW
ncbi:hypothetical protein EMCRGX_G004510 [Ephydatia muelleri]